MDKLYSYTTVDQLALVKSNFIDLTEGDKKYIEKTFEGDIVEFFMSDQKQYFLRIKRNDHVIKVNFNKTNDDWFYVSYVLAYQDFYYDSNFIKCDQIEGLVSAINHFLTIGPDIKNRFKKNPSYFK